ncbi:TlpA family protein disulfide reductase [Streptomyces halobius]|uniref:TlpA family protein disulfide reductase n=1 Tax=Streptomyces halobius TaxID=2879846 RepID=A0ABY4M3S0_9ACTN|nr:TlpA disulfide reductase family protein [Streptomyces halobius]UQA91893.1 TlpA family protein disulfide reductase [Streptomyces halobius]
MLNGPPVPPPRPVAGPRPVGPSRRLALTGLLALAGGTLTACGATRNKQGGDGTLSAAKSNSSTYFEPGERTLTPALKGTTLDGESIDIAGLRGDVVVLNVWGSWCTPCRKEARELARLAEKTEPLGVRFLGINIRDSKTSAKAFEDNYGITYPSIYDTDSRTLLGFKRLAPRAVPTTYVLDRTGTVAAVSIGPLTYRGFLPVIDDVAAEKPIDTEAASEPGR